MNSPKENTMSPEELEQLRDKYMSNTDLPFTNGHLRWLANGAVVTQDAFRRVTELQVKDYFKTDRSDGSGRLRASAFGTMDMAGIEYCERRHLLSFLGVQQDPPDTGSIEIMNTGTQLHYYLQQAGLSEGWLSDIEVPVEHAPWRLRGSMDGLIFDGSGLEIKTTNSTTFTQVSNRKSDYQASGKAPYLAGKKSHLWQIHMYMIAANIDKFSLVYINRAYPSSFVELRVPYDENIAMEVHDAMNSLVECIDRVEQLGELPPMLESCQWETGKTFESCQFRSRCAAAGVS